MPKRPDALTRNLATALAEHLNTYRASIERGDVVAISHALGWALRRSHALHPERVEMPRWLADALAHVVDRVLNVPLGGRGKATPRKRGQDAFRDEVIAFYVEREIKDGWPKAEAYKRARTALGWQMSDDGYRRAHERAKRRSGPWLALPHVLPTPGK